MAGIIGLLRSRKALLGLLSLILIAVGTAWPETRDALDTWGVLIVVIYGLATGTIALEDSVRAWADRPRNIGDSLRLIAEAVDEKGNKVPVELEIEPYAPISPEPEIARSG
jgi:hypothetical protein